MWRSFGIVRQIKLLLLRFVRLQGTPHEVSKGMALGICIGLTPTFGIQMPIALLFAWLLKESKVAAVLGVWITNPLTAPVIYALEYETGRLMLQMQHVGLPKHFTYEAVSQLSWDFLVPFLLGSLVWSILGWVISYYICLRLTPLTRRIRIPRWPRRHWKR